MRVDLRNCDGDDGQYGYVHDGDGGYFFRLPDGLRVEHGVILGTISAADIDAAIESFNADEMDPPGDGFDARAAEAAVREALGRYEVGQ